MNSDSRRSLAVFILVLSVSVPAAAQSDDPAVSFRPFFLATAQQFAAKTTFEAAFGQARQSFLGGGLQVTFGRHVFVEASGSRFRKTGQRAFLNNGTIFRLGIPLTATIRPFEVTGGYRFRFDAIPRLIPYASAGFGNYRYKETSDFASAGEDVSVSHSGFVVAGGAEVRLHRWVGVAVDAQYSHIPGILGDAGLSKDANEKDLGGVAARVKVMVGR